MTLTLSLAPNQYTPRQCDCDFCTSYCAAYLSDPKGTLEINARSALLRKMQGSEQAIFLVCQGCKTLISAAYQQADDTLIGALNSTLLADKALFNAPQSASPKTLAADEKLERWKKLWMKIDLKEAKKATTLASRSF